MKKIFLISLVIAISMSVYSQSNPKILNISKNGSVIYQQRLDGIDSIYFTNLPLVLLSSPANGDTGISLSPYISWNLYPGATSYTLQVSLDSTFNSFVYNSSGLTGTSRTIVGLMAFTKYFWRVQANLTYNSQWSQVWKFTTLFLQPLACGTNLDYGGRTYHSLQIGSQCWLKENLDIGIRINGSSTQTNNGTIEKYCYSNDTANCTMYGGLYQWAEAVQYTNGATNNTAPNPAFTGNIQGICPTGWHLPTYSEFQTLGATVNNDGNTLKAVGQGEGTNKSGFSALLSGYRVSYGGFPYLGFITYFWSSTESGASFAYAIYLNNTDSNISLSTYAKAYGFSARCAKD